MEVINYIIDTKGQYDKLKFSQYRYFFNVLHSTNPYKPYYMHICINVYVLHIDTNIYTAHSTGLYMT